MAYTTINDVSAELGGVEISPSTDITSANVTSWITEVTDEINRLTGMSFESTSITETLDYKGNHRAILTKFPIISIISAEFFNERVGSSQTGSWIALSEGRGKNDNFLLYKGEGLLDIHNHTVGSNRLEEGQQNLRVTYNYGFNQTPVVVKRLATLMVAKRYINAKANTSATNAGGTIRIGAIDVSDPTNYVLSRAQGIEQEEKRLLNEVVGKFKSSTIMNNLY